MYFDVKMIKSLSLFHSFKVRLIESLTYLMEKCFPSETDDFVEKMLGIREKRFVWKQESKKNIQHRWLGWMTKKPGKTILEFDIIEYEYN